MCAMGDRRSRTIVSIGGATIDHHYLLTHLPERDGGAYTREREDAFGGVAANVAVGLHRLGRESTLVARLGTDERAERILSHLRSEGLVTEHVRKRPGETTYCLVLRDPHGERMLVTAGDSAKRLRLDAAAENAIAAADAVFLTAYAPDSVTRSVLDALDTTVEPPALAFDLSGSLPALEDRGTQESTIDRVLDRAALFVAGDVAAASYFGGGTETAVSRLQERRVRRGAITHGTDGATLVTPTDTVHVPAFDVDAVDTTGAGDAYVAGLLDRWVLADETPQDAGRFAAAVAAINCASAYTQPGLPTHEDVVEFLEIHEGT